METIAELKDRGKEKLDDFIADDDIMNKLMQKAAEAKEELETRISEMVKQMYEKMKIAHTGKIEELEQSIKQLRNELALAEARIVNIEMTGRA
jgi:polyhydroxyalkanoate synthesis regulator phasin